ncbi:UNVERIFIED_CONTAM: hypothetical protein Sindi_2485300 [Sesamum indicum]
MVEFVGEPKTEPELNKWMLHVDGSSNAGNGEIGILTQGPENVEIEVATRLSFPVTNNEAEYEALIVGLKLSLEAGAKDLEVFTDSQLVALQIEGTYETKEERMILYHTKAKSIMSKFNQCQVHQIPRHENDRADSLSKFGTTLSGIKDRKVTVMIKETSVIAEVVDVNTASEKPSWKDEIVRYLKEGILPDDSTAARRLKMRAPRFTLVNEQLYKRTVEGPLLKCLDPERAEYVMREIHEGSCGNHSGGRSLAQKVIRQGYFWPTLVKDTKELVKRCEACQKFAAQIHTPATQMEPVKNLDLRQWHSIPRKEDHKLVQRVKDSATLHRSRASAVEWPSREIGEESHRVTMYDPTTNREERCLDLEVIEEKREIAVCQVLHHKSLMMKNYNKRLRPRQFQVGDLVLKKVEVSKHVEKLDLGWKGPYKVTEIKRRGTYRLQDLEGRDLPRPWNVQNLKKFYA